MVEVMALQERFDSVDDIEGAKADVRTEGADGAIEVRSDVDVDAVDEATGTDSERRDVTGMAREAALRWRETRNGDKAFQVEQRKISLQYTVGLRNSLEDEGDAREFTKQFLREIESLDEGDEDADMQAYSEKLKAEIQSVNSAYKQPKKLEFTVEDDSENLTRKTRKEYVIWFKAQQRRSARATLEMCRAVYEAEETLRPHEFSDFCREIGHDEKSSSIRKFYAIGKVYPRLIDYAESLPVAWTSIYLLTQIPADDFDRCIKEGFAFSKLTGAELKALVDKTRDLNNLTSPFKKDKKAMAFPVAKVFFDKLPDDTDFRLLEKALEEVQARLPVKFQFIGEQVKLFKDRASQRYEKLKQEGNRAAVKPSEWDYGSAANAVHVN